MQQALSAEQFLEQYKLWFQERFGSRPWERDERCEAARLLRRQDEEILQGRQ